MQNKWLSNILVSVITLSGGSIASLAVAQISMLGLPTVGGSGCPRGSVSVNVDPDGKGVSILMDSMTAEAGPGIPLMNTRKNCTLLIPLHVPTGFSYALSGVKANAEVVADAGTFVRVSASSYIQGSMARGVPMQTTIRGPINSEFIDIIQGLPAAQLMWSTCNVSRALSVSLNIEVIPSRNGHGLVTLSSDSHIQLPIQVRRCP